MAVRSGRLFSLLKLIGGLENCSLYGVERWPFYSMWLLFGGGSTVIHFAGFPGGQISGAGCYGRGRSRIRHP